MCDETLKKLECGGALKRMICGGAGRIFRGSGFYKTDYNMKPPVCDKKNDGKDPCLNCQEG
jgi:predicted nucleic acid-binding Zn ribbon protein